MIKTASSQNICARRNVLSAWPELLAACIGYLGVAAAPAVLFGLILVATVASQ